MKLEKISLKKLAENSLANREMREIKGGAVCGCGCCYAGTGGSSSTDNGNAILVVVPIVQDVITIGL